MFHLPNLNYYILHLLYWKIYGIDHITNNEFFLYEKKGWIVGTKGHKVNWVEETYIVITQKKKLVL